MELIAASGYEGGKAILSDYLNEVRPCFAPPRTYQRTSYRPGEICQFDLMEPRAKIPVGHGQTRRAWVLTAHSATPAPVPGALIFSRQIPDLIWGMSRCIAQLGALPETVVWDCEGAIHAAPVAPPRPSSPSAVPCRSTGASSRPAIRSQRACWSAFTTSCAPTSNRPALQRPRPLATQTWT